MKYGLAAIFMLILLSCERDDNVDLMTSSDLTGKWIEIKTKTDTLVFESWDTMEVMNLKRGKEMRNGYLLPKAGSGPYEYKLADEKISLYWMLSSNYSFKDYNFKQTGDKLTIDNFYGSSSGATLTFKKLK
jgi:hypothetical protein